MASRILKQNAVYLWFAFLAPAVAVFGHALAPNQPLFKGHDAGVVAGLLMAALVVLTWIPFQGGKAWPSLVIVFLFFVALAWTYQIARTQLDGSVFNLTVVLVPVVLVTLISKPVTQRDLDIALLLMSYSLISISLASIALGFLGWMPDGFAVSDSGENRFFLTEWMGVDSRWGGPFGSVNLASPIGGLLIVIGLTRKGFHRWIIATGGLTILALGQARTTMFAVGAAILVIALWSPLISRIRNAFYIRWTIILGAFIASLILVKRLDPTLSGRTPIWLDFIGLLQTRPIEGVGTSGILDFVGSMSSTPSFVPHTHAHSVLLDGSVRFGIAFTVLTLAILVVAVIASVRALRAGNASPLAVVTFVFVAGLTETIHAWAYWTPYLAALTWAVLSAAGPKPKSHFSSPEKIMHE